MKPIESLKLCCCQLILIQLMEVKLVHKQIPQHSVPSSNWLQGNLRRISGGLKDLNGLRERENILSDIRHDLGMGNSLSEISNVEVSQMSPRESNSKDGRIDIFER
jgi:hypothetical protein